jgi:hypothetical protein
MFIPGMSDVPLDCIGAGAGVPFSAAAKRALLFFVASSAASLVWNGRIDASGASGLAGWVGGKGRNGVVAHAVNTNAAPYKTTDLVCRNSSGAGGGLGVPHGFSGSLLGHSFSFCIRFIWFDRVGELSTGIFCRSAVRPFESRHHLSKRQSAGESLRKS